MIDRSDELDAIAVWGAAAPPPKPRRRLEHRDERDKLFKRDRRRGVGGVGDQRR